MCGKQGRSPPPPPLPTAPPPPPQTHTHSPQCSSWPWSSKHLYLYSMSYFNMSIITGPFLLTNMSIITGPFLSPAGSPRTWSPSIATTNFERFQAGRRYVHTSAIAGSESQFVCSCSSLHCSLKGMTVSVSVHSMLACPLRSHFNISLTP